MFVWFVCFVVREKETLNGTRNESVGAKGRIRRKKNRNIYATTKPFCSFLSHSNDFFRFSSIEKFVGLRANVCVCYIEMISRLIFNPRFVLYNIKHHCRISHRENYSNGSFSKTERERRGSNKGKKEIIGHHYMYGT